MIKSPGKSIRAFCVWCMNGQNNEVKLCPSQDCALFPYRFGKGRPSVRLIRKKCFDCDGEGQKSITNCQFNGKTEELCPLWPYRLGKSVNRSKKVASPKFLEMIKKRALGARNSTNKGLLTQGLNP